MSTTTWPIAPHDSVADLLERLVALGVVTWAELVERDVRLEEVSMSHSAHRVTVDGVARAFAKVVDPVRSSGRTLHAEAAVYRLAQYETALCDVIPACLAIDPDDRVLVLAALPTPPVGASWPYSGPVLDGPDAAPRMRAYGRAVAAIHSVRPAAFGGTPWFLHGIGPHTVADPTLPGATRDFYLRLLADPAVPRAFDVARQEWRPACLMHGDLRWSNVLLDPSEDAPDESRLRLVDWELACLGDPAWDIGSVCADLIGGIALTSGNTATPEQLQAGMAPFLEAYRSGSTDAAPEWRLLLARSMLLAGIRMVQTITEWGHVDLDTMASMEMSLAPWIVELARRPGPMGDLVGGSMP